MSQLSEKAFWSTKRIVAAVLNLAIIPGSGSFLVGRILDGIIQLILSVAGTGLALGGMFAARSWASEVLGHSLPVMVSSSDMEVLKSAYFSNPPTFMGLGVFSAMFLGFILMFLGWVYSIISVFHKPRHINLPPPLPPQV